MNQERKATQKRIGLCVLGLFLLFLFDKEELHVSFSIPIYVCSRSNVVFS